MFAFDCHHSHKDKNVHNRMIHFIVTFYCRVKYSIVRIIRLFPSLLHPAPIHTAIAMEGDELQYADPDPYSNAENQVRACDTEHKLSSHCTLDLLTSSLLQRPLLMDFRPPLRAVGGVSSAADSSDTSSSLEPLS
jgi:hypothetical protein